MLKNENASTNTNVVFDLPKPVSSTKSFLGTWTSMQKFTDKYKKYNGKSVDLSKIKTQAEQWEIISLLERIVEMNTKAVTYLPRLLSDYRALYENAKEISEASETKWHMNVGAGKASAHYNRHSNVERKVLMADETKMVAEKLYTVDINAIVKLTRFLWGIEDCFEENETEATTDGIFYAIWHLCGHGGLSWKMACENYWAYEDYEEIPYSCITEEQRKKLLKDSWGGKTDEEDDSDTDSLKYLNTHEFKYNSFKRLKEKNITLNFPYLTDDELDSLSNIIDVVSNITIRQIKTWRVVYYTKNCFHSCEYEKIRNIINLLAPEEYFYSKTGVTEKNYDEFIEFTANNMNNISDEINESRRKMMDVLITFGSSWFGNLALTEFVKSYKSTNKRAFIKYEKDLENNFNSVFKLVQKVSGDTRGIKVTVKAVDTTYGKRKKKLGKDRLHVLPTDEEMKCFGKVGFTKEPTFFNRKSHKWVVLKDYAQASKNDLFEGWTAHWNGEGWTVRWEEHDVENYL